MSKTFSGDPPGPRVSQKAIHRRQLSDEEVGALDRRVQVGVHFPLDGSTQEPPLSEKVSRYLKGKVIG